MAGLTDYAESLALAYLFSTYPTDNRPTAWYVALFKSSPGEGGGGTEVASAYGYTRKQVTSWSAVSGTYRNPSDITFPAASGGNWGTITHIGIFNASTSGQLLCFAALDVSKTVNDGDTFVIPAAGLNISLD